MSDFAYDIISRAVRKAFDIQSITVVISKVEASEGRFKVRIIDVLSKLEHSFFISATHSIQSLEDFIREAGAKMNLIEAPERTPTEGVL